MSVVICCLMCICGVMLIILLLLGCIFEANFDGSFV